MTPELAMQGPILRLFEVRTKPGCAQTLLDKFATTSAAVVLGKPGNEGYFFGQGIAAEDGVVIFASVWEDLDAVKAHFGDAWRESFLPEGYEAMIDTCTVRHFDLAGGWHVSHGREALRAPRA